MLPVAYTCRVSQESLKALEISVRENWECVQISPPELEGSHLRTSSLRIKSSVSVMVRVRPIDLLPKLEVFCLDAVIEPGGDTDPRFSPPNLIDAREFLPEFGVGRYQAYLGSRQYSVPQWAAGQVSSILVEDLLVFRRPDGMEIVVAPDAQVPGALMIDRDITGVEVADGTLVYLRPL